MCLFFGRLSQKRSIAKAQERESTIWSRKSDISLAFPTNAKLFHHRFAHQPAAFRKTKNPNAQPLSSHTQRDLYSTSCAPLHTRGQPSTRYPPTSCTAPQPAHESCPMPHRTTVPQRLLLGRSHIRGGLPGSRAWIATKRSEPNNDNKTKFGVSERPRRTFTTKR